MVTRIALLVAAIFAISGIPSAVAAPGAAAGPTSQPPTISIPQPATLTATLVPLDVRWPAATPNGAPIHRYELQMSLDSGAWTNVALPARLSRTKTVKVRPWQAVSFRVRAIDKASVAGGWATSEPLWLNAVQDAEDLELEGAWQSVADSKSFGGARLATTSAGASATLTFEGLEVAWVAARGKLKGIADVYVDGELAQTIDLRKASSAKRRVVFRTAWSTSAQHTIQVVAQGTPGRPAVDLDAFIVLGAPRTETLVGAGDIAVCLPDAEGNIDPTTSNAYRTAQLVQGIDGIVFTAGDNSQYDGSAEHFASCYDPTWGVFRDRTRPSPGNHDYKTEGAAPYYDYFGDNAGPAGRGWYRYDAGTWRVYSLNSECTTASQCMADQLAWLASDLKTAPHRCVMAYWHRPRFSTAAHGDALRMTRIFSLLYEHGAELVVSGHDHSFQRFAPLTGDGVVDPGAGVRQLVVGTAGATLYAWRRDDTRIEVRDNVTHGIVRLELAPGSYSWEFLPSDGTFTDSGSNVCH